MDIVEIFSLLMLVLAYMIIIMLIVVYEVTECQFSRLQQMFHTGNHSICCIFDSREQNLA